MINSLYIMKYEMIADSIWFGNLSLEMNLVVKPTNSRIAWKYPLAPLFVFILEVASAFTPRVLQNHSIPSD